VRVPFMYENSTSNSSKKNLIIKIDRGKNALHPKWSST